MNANKKNSGWILRPSKSFPGKFYYFNVLNGDTAWSLEDTEKKDGSPNVIDIHDHPEPSSPPPVDIPQPKYSHIMRPFSSVPRTPQSIPEELNVVWTPVQIQIPIVITPKSRVQNPEPRVDKVKPSQFTIDKFLYNTEKVRTHPQPQSNKIIQLLEPNKDLFVHASSKPLSQRFLNYEKPVINFNKDNKIIKSKIFTSTPIKQTPKFKTVALNTDVSFDLKEKVCEVPSKVTKKVEEVEDDDVRDTNVDVNDLRLVLQAKKRKCLDVGLGTTEKNEAKKIKLVRQEPPSKPKKKVTFEMDYDGSYSIENGSEHENMNYNDSYATALQSLKNLSKSECKDDYWYIVVDTDVLLEEFSFLNSFVKIDGSCKLLIPSSVTNAISSLARGDCRGRTKVMQARNVLRKIPDHHIIVLNAEDETQSPKDGILKTCVEAMDQNKHVILITNDEVLVRTAKCYPIHCYNMQDIKNGLAPEQITQESQNTQKTFISSIFDELNEKEIEIINRLKTNTNTVNKPIISNDSSRISSENSIFTTNKDIISNDCSSISIPNSNSNPKILNSINANSTMITLDHSTVANTTNAYPNSVPNTNSRNENSSNFIEWCTNNQENSKFEQPFEFGKEPALETNKKEPRNFEKGNDRSKFEIDVFKKPQSIKKNNSKVDLREFYVKSKIMENRLKERMDEFVCFFTQILEDSLTGVLLKLSPSVLKSMPPPWSVYEALQCLKSVYKDHSLVRNIVAELHVVLYAVDVSGIDKMKKTITPAEFMKALGCGIHLIQYLKNILPHSEEILDTEKSLSTMLKVIEDPTNDVIEPLVPLPAVSKCRYNEVKHNFVKNTSEIINYLKKHYPEWQNYDDSHNSNMKIVRTCGRDLTLLKLHKKVTVDTANSVVIKRNVGTMQNADVKMRNGDGAMRNGDGTTRNADGTMRNGDGTMRNAISTKSTVATKTKNISTIDTEFFKNCKMITKTVYVANKTDISKINQNNAENTSKMNGPKIVRNMQIIEKFENILKRKKLEAEEYSPHDDDDVTNCSTNNYYKDFKLNTNTKNDFNTIKVEKDILDRKIDSDVKIERKSDDSDVKIERKSDKDDTTNDSGIGNERPEIYSVVTKFSTKLNGSMEKLRTFIDGTFREFHEGKLRKDTKKKFRLKAFEANFMITKIITGLITLIRPKNGRKTNKKLTSKLYSAPSGKTKEVIFKYIKQGQMLQKTLDFMLSVPHEEELDSSMSLNVSS